MGPPTLRCFWHHDPKLSSGQEWETSFPAEGTWLKAAVVLCWSAPTHTGLPMGDGWVYRLAPGQNLMELPPADPWPTLKYRRTCCHLSPKLLAPLSWAKAEQQLPAMAPPLLSTRSSLTSQHYPLHGRARHTAGCYTPVWQHQTELHYNIPLWIQGKFCTHPSNFWEGGHLRWNPSPAP